MQTNKIYKINDDSVNKQTNLLKQTIMKKIRTNTKQQTIKLHKQQNELLSKAIKNHTLNPCEKNVLEVIKRKRFVNELGIRLWQFSLNENHLVFKA